MISLEWHQSCFSFFFYYRFPGDGTAAGLTREKQWCQWEATEKIGSPYAL